MAASTITLVLATAGLAWSAPLGLASCKASAAGHCDRINDKTALFRGTTPDIVHFAPDGTYYQLGSTTVLTGRWRVDESGRNVILRLPGAGQFEPRPIDTYFDNASAVLQGDPAGLATNRRGFYLLPLRNLPVEDIMEQVRAR